MISNKPDTLPGYELQVEVRLSLTSRLFVLKDGVRASLGFEHILCRPTRLTPQDSERALPHKAGSP
jgi:hypothetical protein